DDNEIDNNQHQLNTSNYPFRSTISSPPVNGYPTDTQPREKKRKFNLIQQMYHAIHPHPQRLHHPVPISKSIIQKYSSSCPALASFQEVDTTNHKPVSSWLKTSKIGRMINNMQQAFAKNNSKLKNRKKFKVKHPTNNVIKDELTAVY
ncbi:unnamed protein product, partial [Didymodactylos carnosus]